MSNKIGFIILLLACVAFGALWMFFNRPASSPEASSGAVPEVAGKPVTTGFPPATKRQLNVFKRVDLNGDGVCPKDEFQRAHWNNFAERDKNKNGILERGEFPWAAIAHSDSNKDKKLDRAEYKVRYEKLFAGYDVNKDGFVIAQEYTEIPE